MSLSILSSKSSSYIWREADNLSDIQLVNIFYSAGYHFLDGIIHGIKVFNFDEVYVIYYFLLSLVLLMSYQRNHCLSKSHEAFIPTLPSRSFRAVALLFRSRIHLQCIVWGRGSPFFNTKKHLFFGTLVEKQLTMNTRVYFYTVNSIHYSVCLSLFQNHIVFIRVALS